MQIEWTEEEIEEGRAAARSSGAVSVVTSEDGVAALMSKGAALFLARASGQAMEGAARGVRERGSWSEDLALVVDGVTRDLRISAAKRLSHDLVAQGATVATLQAKLEACEAALVDAQTEAEMEASEAQRLRAEVEELKRVRSVAESRLGRAVLERDEATSTVRRLDAAAEHGAIIDTETHERFQEMCAEVAMLRAKVTDLEKTRDLYQTQRDEYQRNDQHQMALYHGAENRCTAARAEVERLRTENEALHKRLNLGTIQEQHNTIISLRAEVERLKAPLPPALTTAVEKWLSTNRLAPAQVRHGLFPLGMVQRWIERAESAESEVERLKVETAGAQERSQMLFDAKNHWADRARSAESRLAAIRESGVSYRTTVDEYLHAKRRDWDTGPFLESMRSAADAFDDVLEGDAPQEAKGHDIYMCHVENCPDCERTIAAEIKEKGPAVVAVGLATAAGLPVRFGKPDDMDLMCAACDQCTVHRWMPSPDAGPGWRCSECSALSKAKRHPCSPTCTHDDAATPGHPERVKQRSERAESAESEVERLKERTRNWRIQWALVAREHRLAESRLAAIRESARDLSSVAARSDLELFRRWVLEGDAPQEGKDAPLDPTEGRCAYPVGPAKRPCYLPPGHNGSHTARGDGAPYPCSPTCTHDDAATPGHPERMKERSEAFDEVVDAAKDMGVRTDILQRAHDNGAEAMRAACWEIVQTELRLHGWGPGDGPWTRLKAAIEGATP